MKICCECSAAAAAAAAADDDCRLSVSVAVQMYGQMWAAAIYLWLSKCIYSYDNV